MDFPSTLISLKTLCQQPKSSQFLMGDRVEGLKSQNLNSLCSPQCKQARSPVPQAHTTS
jgi:hypothetical protein